MAGHETEFFFVARSLVNVIVWPHYSSDLYFRNNSRAVLEVEGSSSSSAIALSSLDHITYLHIHFYIAPSAGRKAD